AGDAALTARINGLLQFRLDGQAELFRKVSNCGPKDDKHVSGWYSIEENDRGLLSVLYNGYVYIAPSVHGDFTGGSAAVSVDVPTGRRVALGDVVIRPDALRPIVRDCLKTLSASDLDEGYILGYAEDGSSESKRPLVALVVHDGLAVLMN